MVSAGLIVIVPFAGLAVAVGMLWGHGIGLTDVLLAACPTFEPIRDPCFASLASRMTRMG